MKLIAPNPKQLAALEIKAPSPPLEPPTVFRVSYGLFVCPIMLFRVSCLKLDIIHKTCLKNLNLNQINLPSINFWNARSCDDYCTCFLHQFHTFGVFFRFIIPS